MCGLCVYVDVKHFEATARSKIAMYICTNIIPMHAGEHVAQDGCQRMGIMWCDSAKSTVNRK